MLATPAPFPHPGSTGYLKDTADRVRVIQRNADGTLLLAREVPDGGREARMAFHLRGATRNLTRPAAEVFEDKHSAVFGAKPRRQRRRGAK